MVDQDSGKFERFLNVLKQKIAFYPNWFFFRRSSLGDIKNEKNFWRYGHFKSCSHASFIWRPSLCYQLSQPLVIKSMVGPGFLL